MSHKDFAPPKEAFSPWCHMVEDGTSPTFAIVSYRSAMRAIRDIARGKIWSKDNSD
jgi:hypothetical protein